LRAGVGGPHPFQAPAFDAVVGPRRRGRDAPAALWARLRRGRSARAWEKPWVASSMASQGGSVRARVGETVAQEQFGRGAGGVARAWRYGCQRRLKIDTSGG